jgi:hypothetical protein
MLLFEKYLIFQINNKILFNKKQLSNSSKIKENGSLITIIIIKIVFH